MKDNVKRNGILWTVLGIVIFYIASHLGLAIDLSKDKESFEKFNYIADHFEKNIINPICIFNKITDSGSLTFKLPMLSILALMIFLLYKFSTKKKFRKGREHGSARWSTEKEAKSLQDKDKSNNIIFNEQVLMSLNTRMTRKNLNVLILGGSGAGKTRFYVKPNVMQMNTSYVITDPKGEILRSTGKLLSENGYNVKVFNLINMKNSYNYNPFAYLLDVNGNYNDSNVMKLVNTLMKNTKQEGSSGGDQFWDDATKALLMTIIYYLVYEGKEEEKNFATVMSMLKLADAKEEDEDYKSEFDLIFEELTEKNPDHMAVKYYKDYKKAAGKTAKSILISCAVRLQAFNLQDVINITYKDTINISELGEKKTALFVVIPDSDDTFNFLVAMLYTQIFDVLYGVADFKYGGRLPVHVRLLLDEFANIGTIPRFDKLIATMRSREISVNTIIQNIAQLKTMYKESWESIIGNCDSLLFLGGKEQGSLDYISKALGKETIDTESQGLTKSAKSNSSNVNSNILGRELMTPDEVGSMPDSDCILLIRGMRPFYSKKFPIEKHENYKYLEDFDKLNAFDISHIKTEIMPVTSEKNDKKSINKIDDGFRLSSSNKEEQLLDFFAINGFGSSDDLEGGVEVFERFRRKKQEDVDEQMKQEDVNEQREFEELGLIQINSDEIDDSWELDYDATYEDAIITDDMEVIDDIEEFIKNLEKDEE